MPGVIIFGRRWSVGSDDFVVPGLVLFFIHLAWLITLLLILYTVEFDRLVKCIDLLWYYIAVYTSLEFALSINELFVCIISMRGSILNTSDRSSILYWLYIRLILMLCNFTAIGVGVTWAVHYYPECPLEKPKEIVAGCVFCNLFCELFVVMTMYCVFDPAGRSWVKMKKYQRSMKESESRFNYRRSGSTNRNWRQRKVIRAYQDSWNQRCRFFFCCMNTSDRNKSSFSDIAKLLSDFFRDLDVVPSDVVAGLILLRKFQKVEREAVVRQKRQGIFEYLSGVAITENTQFLALNDSKDYEQFQNVIHYMYYAISAYGWPMYLITHSKTGLCEICPNLDCCFVCFGRRDKAEVIEDNCCRCNYAALKQMLSDGDVEVIYATFHVDIGETPFFVAIDYVKQKIVVSIRGTLSMQDILTDLNAEGEPLPLNPPKEDWLGHKGMVQAAVYIKNKLRQENLIEKALNHNPSRGTQSYGLVFVGHSLGAGTASILAILMREEYSDLQCYSYSPPGGLLSMPAVEYSKDFIISVVVGKDLVPRIGLHQMEALRNDLINAIQRSIDPKWKTIACNVICCCCGPEPTSVTQMSEMDSRVNAYKEHKDASRHSTVHPNDNSIALTLHHPLYPPGRIIHVVRHHPTDYEQAMRKHAPVYQAIWAKTTDFDEVLISPVMLSDHMPDTVLSALEKVITNVGPRKPQRQSHHELSNENHQHSKPPPKAKISNPQQLTPNSQRILLETAFGMPPNQIGSKPNGIHNGNNIASVPLRKAATRNAKTVAFKPTTLSLCETRPNPYLGKALDLIHDDWFGLAPLASPESLSELSSISSRASISLNLNLSTSVENFLNKHIVNVKTPTPPPDDDIEESQMRTPVVIRRTPKFSENLAFCAEDWKSQNNYKRMGQVFITTPKLHDSDSDGDGSYGTPKNYSFESYSINNNLDESLTPIIQQPNRRFLVSDTTTMINDCSSQCPVCPCTKLPPEGCCQRSDHIACIMMSVQEQKCSGKYSITNTTSSSDTYYSLTTGSECGDNFMSNGGTKVLLSKLGTYDEETLTCELTSAQNCNTSANQTATISSITKSGILESHFPVYFDSSDERSSLLSNENESPRQRSSLKKLNGNNSNDRKKSNDVTSEINSKFTRNESLPLLSSLLEKSSPTNYMKRKKMIYPIHTPPMVQHSPRVVPAVRSKSTPTSVTNLYIFHNESNV